MGMRGGKRDCNAFGQALRINARILLLVILAALPAIAVDAKELPCPKERVILSVFGKISHQNYEGVAKLDRPMLASIGMTMLNTHSVYSTNAHDWNGVLMRDLLAYVGAHGQEVEFRALDGYHITIPVSDFFDFDVLLAMQRDGQDLSIRSRGPTRLIYPIDNNRALRSQKYTPRFVWQIEKMTVK
ncbi:molybdopterin-dependent oxidoreductase [uncultured Cohaesibacter sp.]|uniref:molybdopterin-dependent oxidoreductase n=1 Tax=uncultured Cohaesibacter sp. TaxID=1002546 RepID=UPI002931116A|nr:molybdopterin-dependent oxidoreductase [uncultured Cohaesibacter sp.]